MGSRAKVRGTVTTVTALAALAGVAFAAPACGGDDPVTEPADAEAPRPEAPPEGPPASRSDGGGASYVPIDVDCPIGTAVEIEPNDSPAEATTLDGELSLCGAISPGDDVDYSRFETPPGNKLALFQAVIDGKVDFELVVNGATLRPTDVKKFVAGEYVVKAFTTDGKPGKYRYRIQYEP